jgi:hypothetical protein
MSFRSLVSSLFLSIAAMHPAGAATITITFDTDDPLGGLSAGSVLGSQYSAFGVVFSPNAFSGAGGPSGSWATNTDMSIVSRTGFDVGGFGSPSLVSGNLLRSFTGWLNEDGDPSFHATFSTPILSFSAHFRWYQRSECDAHFRLRRSNADRNGNELERWPV